MIEMSSFQVIWNSSLSPSKKSLKSKKVGKKRKNLPWVLAVIQRFSVTNIGYMFSVLHYTATAHSSNFCKHKVILRVDSLLVVTTEALFSIGCSKYQVIPKTIIIW